MVKTRGGDYKNTNNKTVAPRPKAQGKAPQKKKVAEVVTSPSPATELDSVSLSTATSSTKTKRPGLPAFVVTQLLEDIEEAGGIDKFKDSKDEEGQILCALLEKNQRVYGKKKEPRRRQLGNKFDKLKRLQPLEYLTTLAKFSVTPFAFRQQQEDDDIEIASPAPSTSKTLTYHHPPPVSTVSVPNAAAFSSPVSATTSHKKVATALPAPISSPVFSPRSFLSKKMTGNSLPLPTGTKLDGDVVGMFVFPCPWVHDSTALLLATHSIVFFPTI